MRNLYTYLGMHICILCKELFIVLGVHWLDFYCLLMLSV